MRRAWQLAGNSPEEADRVCGLCEPDSEGPLSDQRRILAAIIRDTMDIYTDPTG